MFMCLSPIVLPAAALACTSWLMLCVVLGHELVGCYVPKARRPVRFAVILVTSSELVKLRMLVTTQPEHDYFFFLYMTYVGMQVHRDLFWV